MTLPFEPAITYSTEEEGRDEVLIEPAGFLRLEDAPTEKPVTRSEVISLIESYVDRYLKLNKLS